MGLTVAAARRSGIQQVKAASFPECVEPVLVACQDRRVRKPLPNSLQRLVISKQAQVGVDFPGVRVGRREVSGDLKPDPQRVKSPSIGDSQPNTAASLSGKLARIRSEPNGVERHARQRDTVEIACQHPAVNPGCADHLKRGIGAAPDRHIGRLQQANTWIQNRCVQAADIRRRVYPWQLGRVKIVPAVPAMHFDYLQIDIDSHFNFEKVSQFADGHPVTNRQTMKADEGLLAFIQHRAANVYAVDRIRAVENNKSDVAVSGSLHRVAHRRNIGIEARTDVLNIKHNSIDTLEHRRRWSSNVSVKTQYRNTGSGFNVIRDMRNVEFAAEAVFRTEDFHELDVLGVVQMANRALPMSIDTGVIGNQRDASARERCEVVPRQNIDTSQHSSVIAAGKQREQAEQKGEGPDVKPDVRSHRLQLEQHN